MTFDRSFNRLVCPLELEDGAEHTYCDGGDLLDFFHFKHPFESLSTFMKEKFGYSGDMEADDFSMIKWLLKDRNVKISKCIYNSLFEICIVESRPLEEVLKLIQFIYEHNPTLTNADQLTDSKYYREIAEWLTANPHISRKGFIALLINSKGNTVLEFVEDLIKNKGWSIVDEDLQYFMRNTLCILFAKKHGVRYNVSALFPLYMNGDAFAVQRFKELYEVSDVDKAIVKEAMMSCIL